MKQLMTRQLMGVMFILSITFLTSLSAEGDDLIKDFIKYEVIVNKMMPDAPNDGADMEQVAKAHKTYTDLVLKSSDQSLKYAYVKQTIISNLEILTDVDWKVKLEDFKKEVAKFSAEGAKEFKLEDYLKYKSQLSVVYAKELKKNYGTIFSPKIESFIGDKNNNPSRAGGLSVLDSFVGTWDQKGSIKAPGQKAFTANQVSYRSWSKNKKIILFREEGPQEQHFPLTYDSATDSYRGVFMSGVNTGTVFAKWDKEKRTMTFEINFTDGSKYKGTHRFIRDDYAEVEGKVRDADGNVTMEMSWKQSRR